MGVHGLWELLAPVGRRVSVDTLGNKKLAIDASIWIVQFLKAMRDDRGDVLRNAHLLGFFRRICKLLYLRVKPVFVFDGGTPFLKRKTVIARRRQRDQAQSKIRKTAEKLLLNQLKARKVEELIREEERRNPQNQQNPQEESESRDAKQSQEEADALLAASLAKEWENDDAPIELQPEDDSDEDIRILPVAQGKVDPAVLASLPPSMQLRLLDEMREHLVAENRQKFQSAAKIPSSFSELQIEAYLKTVAFRREIVEVQKAAGNPDANGVPSTKIASEINREFIFTKSQKDDDKRRGSKSTIFKAPQDGQKRTDSVPSTTAVNVQTYLDDQGRKRVSRIRGMGVRMTRDLQWNLYLMKDKEMKQTIEPAEQDDPAYRNIVLENLKTKENADDSEIEWDDEPVSQNENYERRKADVRTISISLDDDDQERSDDEIFKMLVSSPTRETENASAREPAEDLQEIEREEYREALGFRVLRTEGAGFRALESACSKRDRVGSKNIQVSFEVDDLEESDDQVFRNLVSSSTPVAEDEDDGIEWEDGNNVQAGDGAATTGLVEDSGVGADDEIEWEDGNDVPAAEVPEKSVETEDRHGMAEECVETTEDRHEIPEKSKDHKKVAEYIVEFPQDEASAGVASTRSGGVSEEQEQIEEAIRRSMLDFGPQRVFKPLRIQETSSPTMAANGSGEDEMRARKGKAVLEEDVPRRVHPNNENAADRDEGTAQKQSAFVTEEEENFLQSEERRAALDEERERLFHEIADLRAEKRKNERNAEAVTSEMFSECQELLQLFGIPYVVAPMEAEAQCAFMDTAELVDGVITDDSDVFLFGARSVYKNLFDGHKYVETYYMKDVHSDLGLTQEKLIRMAMLLGSDYTEGISGIGIVNAIEVVNAFPEEDGLLKFREWIDSPDLKILDKLQGRAKNRKTADHLDENQAELESNVDERKRMFMEKHRAVSKNWSVPSTFPSKAVAEAYSTPQVDKSAETFAWGRPDLELLRKFCFEKFGWNKDKADELLVPVLKEYDRRETQTRLDQFYSFNERFAKIRSRRIQKAVTGITGRRQTEIMDASADVAPPKKQRRQKASIDPAATPKKRQKKTEGGGEPKKARARKPRAQASAPQKSSRVKKKIGGPSDLENTGCVGFANEDVNCLSGNEGFRGGGFVNEEDMAPADLNPSGFVGFAGNNDEVPVNMVPDTVNPDGFVAADVTNSGGFIVPENTEFISKENSEEEGTLRWKNNRVLETGQGDNDLQLDQNGETRVLPMPFFSRKRRKSN